VTNAAILGASGLLLIAYLLDLVGRKLKVPTVVLLIAAGMALREGFDLMNVHLRWVDPVVPIIGTLGLILIVLDGALDLRIRRERAHLDGVASGAAVGGFLVCTVLFAALFRYALGLDTFPAVLMAFTFAVISSSVAIPSAAALPESSREFVVYESSLSDVLGVLAFYAWLDAHGVLGTFELNLTERVTVSLVIAAGAAVALHALLARIRGRVRFMPLLAALIFLYAAGKALHLSPLIIVLVCGLLLNNPELLERIWRVRDRHSPDYDRALADFKGLVGELTFATKSFFFLLLGYWTDLGHMSAPQAWWVTGLIVAIIVATRFALLAALRQPRAGQLTWVAPRGLITVLLFLAAAEHLALGAFPFGTVLLVVLITSMLVVLARRGEHRALLARAETAESAEPQ